MLFQHIETRGAVDTLHRWIIGWNLREGTGEAVFVSSVFVELAVPIKSAEFGLEKNFEDWTHPPRVAFWFSECLDQVSVELTYFPKVKADLEEGIEEFASHFLGLDLDAFHAALDDRSQVRTAQTGGQLFEITFQGS